MQAGVAAGCTVPSGRTSRWRPELPGAGPSATIEGLSKNDGMMSSSDARRSHRTCPIVHEAKMADAGMLGDVESSSR